MGNKKKKQPKQAKVEKFVCPVCKRISVAGCQKHPEGE